MVLEDEVLIAEMVKMYLGESGHEVVDICISYEEGVQAFEEHNPDLVILDIHLYGEKSGIDFARYIHGHANRVPYIFLTSQHSRPVFDQALDTTPMAYLTKPIKKEALWTSVETAVKLFKENNSPRQEIFSVSDGYNNHQIQMDEIVYVKSEHVYSIVHLTKDRKLSVRLPISQFLEKLNHSSFFQCHRSFVINTLFVSNWNNKTVNLGGVEIPISRSKKEQFSSLMKSG